MSRIHPELASALSGQANYERLASASYEAIAYWCESEDYSGFAQFFFKQAAEERLHAEKIFRHLLDRGSVPELTALEAARSGFGSLHEAAQFAQKLEKDNTASITRCLESAIEARDFPAQAMLNWFISEQVEEEAWAARMTTLTGRASTDADLMNLDRHIMVQLGAAGAAAAPAAGQ